MTISFVIDQPALSHPDFKRPTHLYGGNYDHEGAYLIPRSGYVDCGVHDGFGPVCKIDDSIGKPYLVFSRKPAKFKGFREVPMTKKWAGGAFAAYTLLLGRRTEGQRFYTYNSKTPCINDGRIFFFKNGKPGVYPTQSSYANKKPAKMELIHPMFTTAEKPLVYVTQSDPVFGGLIALRIDDTHECVRFVIPAMKDWRVKEYYVRGLDQDALFKPHKVKVEEFLGLLKTKYHGENLMDNKTFDKARKAAGGNRGD